MATVHTASFTGTTTSSPTRLSALNGLTAATLIVSALSLIYAQAILVKTFELDLSIFAVLELSAAALIVKATRWRWTPLLSTLFGVLVITGNSGPIIYDLTHPASFHPFAFMVVAVTATLIGIIAGICAAVQNYRRPASDRPTPRFLAAALVGMTMFGIGALSVGAIPQQASAAIDPAVLAGLPAVATPGFAFDRPEMTVHVGETVALRLDNTHGAPHSFDIDELNVHVPMPVGSSNLALFKPTTAGIYTYYCNVPGHRELGMVGTLVVAP